MRELEADDDVETGQRLRVRYDGNTVEGTVTELKHGGDKIVIDGDDDESYVLYKPWIAGGGWDFDQGPGRDAASRTRLSEDAEAEVLDE